MDDAIRDYARGLAIVAALALIALAFVINPMPWSALGQAADHEEQVGNDGVPSIDLSHFDIPEGWAPGEGARIVLPSAPSSST
jgi:hypothetical protein